jgi:hypothetical protein
MKESMQRPKKIAIVGCSDSKDMAPFNDPTWEIWGVNNLFFHIPRWNRWFEIHNITRSEGQWMRRGSSNFRGQDINAYVADLAKMTCPVYMQRHWDEIPSSTPYPLNEIKRRFGSVLGWYNCAIDGVDEDCMNPQLYGTNTVTYMILLAILEGATHIGVWGVDMAVDTEYHYQRPSCEYALGVAIGLGIQVYVPPQADLLKAVTLYGFEERLNDEWMQKIKKMSEAMAKRQDKATHELSEADAVLFRAEGALRVLKTLKETNNSDIGLLSKLAEIEQGIAAQCNDARGKREMAYSQQQQYSGARMAVKELGKIWSTMQ